MSPVSYIFSSKWWVPRWQSFSVCDILRGWASWRQRGRGGSACLLWFTVIRVPVSRQAWSSGSCTPALSHTSAWQAKLLKGRTGARRPRLARLTHETKTQCYRPASASLWCQSVLLIRESLEGYLLCLYHLSRLPPDLLYEVVGADTALLEDTAGEDNCWWSIYFLWNSFEVAGEIKVWFRVIPHL